MPDVLNGNITKLIFITALVMMYRFVLLLVLLVVPNISSAYTETTKIYSGASDGHIITVPYPASWDDQYANILGRAVDYSSEYIRVQSSAFYTPSGYLGIIRGFLTFDTSVIPDEATIISAELGVSVKEKQDDYNDSYAYITVLEGFQEPLVLSNSDIGNCGDKILLPTRLSNDLDITNLDVNQYSVFEINQTGLDSISKGGFTKLCIREGHDIENIEVVKNVNDNIWKASSVHIASADNSDENIRPYLEITYEVSGDSENSYPLYTQIKSSYPSLEETGEWANDTYANGNASCGATIADCGCAITSLVMMSRANGVTIGVDGEDITPGTLNNWLIENQGYNQYGSIIWAKALEYFGEKRLDEKVETKFSLSKFKTNDQSLIQDSVLNDNSEVITFTNKVRGGHYLLFTDYLQSEDTFAIRDPWYYNTRTFNDLSGGDKVLDYDNQSEHSNVFLITEPQVATGYLDISLGSPAELKLVDSNGLVTGFTDGGVLSDIDGSGYLQEDIIGNPANQDEYVEPDHYPKRLIVTKSSGEYELEVIGTGSGEYKLEIYLKNGEGDEFYFKFSSTTENGKIDTFTINTATGEIAEMVTEEIVLNREVFIALVIDATKDERKSVQEFFVGGADRIFNSIDKARNGLAILELRIFEKLLEVKGVDDPKLVEAIDELMESLK